MTSPPPSDSRAVTVALLRVFGLVVLDIMQHPQRFEEISAAIEWVVSCRLDNRCVWCGYLLNHPHRPHNDCSAPTGVEM